MALAPTHPTEKRVADLATRQQETADAYLAGVGAVTKIVGHEGSEAVFMHAFENGCPYRAVAWGDVGHKLPAWQRGFNTALAAHYGLKTINLDDQPPGVREAMNGRNPNDSGKRIEDFLEAMSVATTLTTALGFPIWPEDRGDHVRPRFACIKGFQIGEPVSYGFNGDSYIAGRIIDMRGAGSSVQGWRIITTKDVTGKVRKFWRRGMSGSWKHDGTWSLIHGWHRDRNPEF